MNIENKENYKEKMQMLADSFSLSCEFVENTVRRIMTFVHEVAEAANRVIASMYVNKRVIHLVRHSKKARVRKKNMHRIMKSIQRGVKNG